MRFKNRYLLLEVVWKDGKTDLAITELALLGVFRESIKQNFGDYGLGLALASVQVKFYNPITNLCIVRSSRDQHRQVWCALSLISSIRHRTVLIRLLHLKGTTRTALRAAELAESLKLQVLQPTTAQLKVCQEMEEKLKTLEL